MPGLMDSLKDRLKYLRMSKEVPKGRYESSGPLTASEMDRPTASRSSFPSEKAGSGAKSYLEAERSEPESDFQKRLRKLQEYVDDKLEPVAGPVNSWAARRGVDFKKNFGKGY